MRSYRGHKLWDYRCHPSRRMAFKTADGSKLDEIKRRALRALYEHCQSGQLGVSEIEGPLWALVDVIHGNERVKHACQWFRIAASYSEDDEMRLVACMKVYGWIERALRCNL